jgi:hypothetical protein
MKWKSLVITELRIAMIVGSSAEDIIKRDHSLSYETRGESKTSGTQLMVQYWEGGRLVGDINSIIATVLNCVPPSRTHQRG